MNKEFLWVEKYRPNKIDDIVLPDDIKETFKGFLDNGDLPNLLLTGSGGVGKTTIAKAVLKELDCDYIMINGSDEGRLIDVVRNKIKNFASSRSFKQKRKFVIIDEADYMNAESVQPALRNFMEEYSSNCGFILTCNFPRRILDLIHSRCTTIDFTFTNEDKPKLALSFFKRCTYILEQENIEYDKKVVVEVINKFFPDYRRILNELQKYSSVGKIDSGILARLEDVSIKDLMEHLKAKRFNDMRKWVAHNNDASVSTLFRAVFDNAETYVKKESIPQLCVILADYQYKSAFVADQEINLAAMFTELMVDCEWK